MEIVLNEHNLKLEDIKYKLYKSRAILVNDNDEIIICNYNGVYLLPGGSLEKDETPLGGLIRELKEEIGVSYSESELSFLTCLKYYQKDYPRIEKDSTNRYVETNYFVGKFKGYNLDNIKLTENEKNSNFKIELVSLDKIQELLNNINSDNPRIPFFNKELNTILNYYNK